MLFTKLNGIISFVLIIKSLKEVNFPFNRSSIISLAFTSPRPLIIVNGNNIFWLTDAKKLNDSLILGPKIPIFFSGYGYFIRATI